MTHHGEIEPQLPHGVEEPQQTVLDTPAGRPARWVLTLNGVVLLALMVLITVAVFLRVVGVGVTGAVEIGAMAMVVLVSLGMPAVTAAGENFSLDVVEHFTRARTLRVLDVTGLVLQFTVALVVLVFLLMVLVHDIRTGVTTGGELSVPRFWLTGVVTLGFLGMVHALVIRALTRTDAEG